jgi:hypothetical protein
MARKKSTPYAVGQDNVLYVDCRACGISALVRLVDGLAFTIFKGEKRQYMKLVDVIEWHVKELRESNGQSGNQRIVDLLREAEAKFMAGKVVEV